SDRHTRHGVPEHDLAGLAGVGKREGVVGYQDIAEAVSHLNRPAVPEVVENVVSDGVVVTMKVEGVIEAGASARPPDIVKDIAVDSEVMAARIGVDPVQSIRRIRGTVSDVFDTVAANGDVMGGVVTVNSLLI